MPEMLADEEPPAPPRHRCRESGAVRAGTGATALSIARPSSIA
jgi:hypothetical protein